MRWLLVTRGNNFNFTVDFILPFYIHSHAFQPVIAAVDLLVKTLWPGGAFTGGEECRPGGGASTIDCTCGGGTISFSAGTRASAEQLTENICLDTREGFGLDKERR